MPLSCVPFNFLSICIVQRYKWLCYFYTSLSLMLAVWNFAYILTAAVHIAWQGFLGLNGKLCKMMMSHFRIVFAIFVTSNYKTVICIFNRNLGICECVIWGFGKQQLSASTDSWSPTFHCSSGTTQESFTVWGCSYSKSTCWGRNG